MDLEIIATSAVKSSISKTDLLSPFINEVDKEPSWDGNIYIYQSKAKKKDGIKKVPVQVKGKRANIFSQETIKYRVYRNDLENYLTDGGVFYFVVYIDSSGGTRKIYYCSLLPIKIRFLLEQSHEAKSLNIELKEFPNDNLKKQSLLLTFYSNMQKQTSFAHAKLFSLDELEKQGILESVSFSVTGFKNQYADSKELLFQDDLYMYANVKGSTIPQPIEGIPINIHMAEDVVCDVSVGGKSFYKNIRRVYSKGEATLHIGNSINIRFMTNEQKMIVNISPSDMLNSALVDLDFILSIYEHKGFEYNRTFIPLDTSKIYSKVQLEALRSNLKYCQEMKSVLNTLKLNMDVDLKNMSDEDRRNTHRLIKALVYDEEIPNLKPDIPFVTKVDYLGAKVALVFSKVRDQNTYKIYNFADMPFVVYFEDESGKKYITSQYEILKADDFLELSNIDYNSIIESFKAINENYIYTRANQILLELLLAYDKSKDTRKDILKAADILSKWLFNVDVTEEVFEKDIRRVNYYQVKKRLRRLNKKEKIEIEEVVERRWQSQELIVGGYLLLGNAKEAEKTYSQMSDAQKEVFDTFPINRFWKKQ